MNTTLPTIYFITHLPTDKITIRNVTVKVGTKYGTLEVLDTLDSVYFEIGITVEFLSG